MPIYVARWEEVTEPDGGTAWKPLGVGDSSFAAIDLTPPGAAPWRCLFRSPVVLADVPGRRRLSEPGERLTTLIRNRLGNDLGITLEDRPSMAEILAHILLDHAREDGTRWRPLKPERDGATRIYLGGQVWEMLPIRGGASITDDFNRANNTNISTGAPFSWTEVVGSWEIFTNKLRNNATAGRARAESDLASADHYAQVDCGITGTPAGPVVRYASGADTCYQFNTRSDTTRRLDKVVAGTYTELAASATSLPTGTVTLKAEINGSTLKGFEAGAEVLSVTDTAITGNTRTGVMVRGSGTTVDFDNFSAADLAAGADATATPGVIATTTSAPALSISTGSTTTPASIDTTAALPTASLSAGSTLTPTATAVVVSTPQAVAGSSMTVTPAAIAAVTSLPAATIQIGTDATATPSAIAVLIATPTASLTAISTVTPSPVTIVVSFPAAFGFIPTFRYLFTPPVHEPVAWESGVDDKGRRADPVWRHFDRGDRGKTVVRTNGQYATYITPLYTVLEGADSIRWPDGTINKAVFLGGHITEVTETIKDELVAAGYSVESEQV